MTTPVKVPARFKNSPHNQPETQQSSTHLYAIGQAVRLKVGLWQSGDIYLITAKLPPIGDSPQYRIRNEEERFERVTTQDNIERADKPTDAVSGAFAGKSADLNRKAEAGKVATQAEPPVR